MTRRRRPRNAAESYRNTRRSMGDGTMSGRSRIATPHDTTKLRRATSIVPSGNEPIGETVTVTATTRDGNDLIWNLLDPGPIPAGRPQTFPTTALVTRTGGYYVLHLEKLDLVSLGGATVTVTTSSGLSRTAAAPSFGRHLRGADIPLGTLPRGTTVTVSCDQPIVSAIATLEYKDVGAFVMSDVPIPLQFFLTYLGGTAPNGLIPGGTQEGNRLFVGTFTRNVFGGSHSITSAGTWTQLAVGSSGSGRATLWTKLASASEPTVTWNGSDTDGHAGIYVVRAPGAVVVDAGAGAASAGSGALETEFAADAGPGALLLAWTVSGAGGAGAVSWVKPDNSEVDYIHTGDPDSAQRDAKAGLVALPAQNEWRARRELGGHTGVVLAATVVTLS